MKLDHYSDSQLQTICIGEQTSFVSAMEIMNAKGLRILPVADSEMNFIGVLADGDIRRWLAKNSDLTSPITEAINRTPKFSPIPLSKEEIQRKIIETQAEALPILLDGKLVEFVVSWQFGELNGVVAVIMAGGLGTRLSPLTDNCPKPLLMLNDKPILLHLVEELKNQGVQKFVFCLNFLPDQIISFFGDGSEFDVKIDYVIEEQRLGTGGALSLIDRNLLSDTFISLNGDVLNNVNYAKLVEEHQNRANAATMVTRSYRYTMPYGSVEYDENNEYIRSVEKPTTVYKINAGIYCFSKTVLDYVPEGEYFDMPTLFENLVKDDKKCGLFTHAGDWIDIGSPEEFERAKEIYRGRK